MKQGYVLLTDKLQGEYKAAFEQVELYSTTNLIGVDADSELMMELLDNMLTAQEEGKPVSQIVGDDIELFCTNFFSEYKAGDRFVDFLKGVYRIAWILFVFELLDLLLDLLYAEDKGALSGPSDIGPYLVGAALGIALDLVVYVLLRPLMRRSKKIKPFDFSILFFVLIAVTLVLAVVFANRYSIMVPRVAALLIPAIYIICFISVRAYMNYRKYGTVKAPKQETVSFTASVRTNMEEELPGDFLKQFEKKNEKREKHGKMPLSEAEYLKKLDKTYNYRKNAIVNCVIFGGITIMTIAAMTIGGEFETMPDFIFFAVFLVALEGSICYFISKPNKVCSRIYHEMRKTMEEENLTLAQYVEQHNKSTQVMEQQEED